MLVHATLPVSAGPGRGRGVEIADLPQIEQAATIVHRGSVDNVVATIQALARWTDAHGAPRPGTRRPCGGWLGAGPAGCQDSLPVSCSKAGRTSAVS